MIPFPFFLSVFKHLLSERDLLPNPALLRVRRSIRSALQSGPHQRGIQQGKNAYVKTLIWETFLIRYWSRKEKLVLSKLMFVHNNRTRGWGVLKQNPPKKNTLFNQTQLNPKIGDPFLFQNSNYRTLSQEKVLKSPGHSSYTFKISTHLPEIVESNLFTGDTI